MTNPALTPDDSILSGRLHDVESIARGVEAQNKLRTESLEIALPSELFKCQARREIMAQILSRHSGVIKVYYPGPDDPTVEIVEGANVPISEIVMLGRVLSQSWRICMLGLRKRSRFFVQDPKGRLLPIETLSVPLDFAHLGDIEKVWRAYQLAESLTLCVVGEQCDDVALEIQSEFGFGDVEPIDSPANKGYQKRMRDLVKDESCICVGTHRLSHAHTKAVSLRTAKNTPELKRVVLDMLLSRVK